MPSQLQVGVEAVFESRVEGLPFSVVFEDDGETGYLYALDARRGDQPIVDALHIYNVGAAADAYVAHDIRFEWSEDELAVVLLLDDQVHAMADFAEPRLMCRSGFPPPASDAPVSTHDWDSRALAHRFAHLRDNQ